MSDELIQALLCDAADALIVDVNAMGRAGLLSIDQHPKSRRCSRHCQSHDEVQIAGVKTVDDASIGCVQYCGLFFDSPIP